LKEKNRISFEKSIRGTALDLMATAAKALKESHRNSVQSSEWKESEGLLLFYDRIYVPNNVELYQRIVK
jgi:hypothetical protein